MSTKRTGNPDPRWQKGVKGGPNPAGRPKNSGRPISKLRGTLNKLKGLEEDAVEIISKALAGEFDDKERTDLAKWVINILPTYTRAAIAEESYKTDLKESQQSQEEAKKTGTDNAPARFTMTLVEDVEE